MDCGICKRDFFARCDEAGFDPANLEAVLITHDHTDHTKASRGAARPGEAGHRARGVRRRRRARGQQGDHRAGGRMRPTCVLLGRRAVAGGHAGARLRTSHDAASSCGFRVEADGDAVGFMTDTGIVTGEADEALRDVRILALESNHDVQMLKDGPYPYPVKRRVGSDTGHLSNVQAADELEALLSDALEQVVAMHISQNNNTYRLPGEALTAVVRRAGHPATVQVAYQTMLMSAR
ncbi:MAG: MBL fold metallo-hydrolase [Eggerthella lenta]